MKIIYTCLVTLTTCHSLPCLPSSKRFGPLLIITEPLNRSILLLSHHLSPFRHDTYKALTISLQRKRSCANFFLCLPPPDCFRSPPLCFPLWYANQPLSSNFPGVNTSLPRKLFLGNASFKQQSLANILIQLYNTSAHYRMRVHENNRAIKYLINSKTESFCFF